MRLPAVLVIFGLLLAVAARPQAPSKRAAGLVPRGPEQPDRRLLDLNVIAVDNHGQPVTDLKADDFQITDAGKSQEISFFRVNQLKAKREPLSALGPHEMSNRAGDQTPGATVILFDLLNLGFGARGMATAQLERELPQIDAADSLYLYVLSVDGVLAPVHDIHPPTASGEQPLSMSEPASGPWTRGTKPMLENVLRAVLRIRPIDIDVFTRILITFHALESLGSRVAAIPGRKNVIWITDGVPFALGEMRSDTGEPVDFTPEIRRLSEALDRSYIALYPVRQIMMGRSDNIGATSDGNGATGGAGTGISEIATLDLFADLTGGRRSSDKVIGPVIQQSMRDLNFSYQVGYYPPPANWDNKFHKLRITTKRKGLRIQSKSGYYAWRIAAGRRSDDAFAATAKAPLDAEEIGLRASVSPDPAHRGASLLSLRISAQDLSLVPNGDYYTDELRLMAVGYSAGGAISSGPPQPLDIRFSAAEREQALKQGIYVTEVVPVTKDVDRLRMIVFDRGSNGVGSITIPSDKLRSQE